MRPSRSSVDRHGSLTNLHQLSGMLVERIMRRPVEEIYEQNQHISQNIKDMREVNNRLRIKILNIEKSKGSIKENFQQICKILLKQNPQSVKKCDPPQIQKTKIKFKYLKSKINEHTQQMKEITKENKCIKLADIKNKCKQIELENIQLMAQIERVETGISLLSKQKTVPTDCTNTSMLDVVFDDTKPDNTETRKYQLLKYIENGRKQIDELDKHIKKQEEQIQLQQKRKSELMLNYNAWNRLLAKKEDLANQNTLLNQELIQLSEKLRAVDVQLEKQNQLNQELKLKLMQKKDLENKQLKNLKQEIEKCLDQIKEIKRKTQLINAKNHFKLIL